MPHASSGLGSTFARAWRAYTHRGGAYQTTVLASIVYYVLLGPSALVGRLFGAKLLDAGPRKAASYWLERPERKVNLAEAEKQF